MELFADIIIDISHSKLDQTFQYRIPERLQGILEPGNVVEIPFGRGDRLTKGYVLRITEYASCPLDKMKSIETVVTDLAGADSKLTALALWMRDYYGCTTVQALRTVLPFRQKASVKKKRTVVLRLPAGEAQQRLEWFRSRHQAARARLLEALLEEPALPYEVVTGSLKITAPVLRAMEEQGILSCESQHVYRTPAVLCSLREEEENRAEQLSGTPGGLEPEGFGRTDGFVLNEEQQFIVDEVRQDWQRIGFAQYLIHGVTGSGKTAVYMELIALALARGEQAILLIPEISLTYQNVLRFYHRFGDRISILHSRLSPAERYDQFERARSGDIDVMIGPRSALFTPFQKLGIIIIDEEHETSYKSEAVPRYHARETAKKRAMLEGARLVLGSATPSLEAYYEAENGRCRLFTLQKRAAGGTLPRVCTVDMRTELREGNRSILSRSLSEKIGERLERGEQAMLFLNRRGYSGFVSCRSCGHVMKCPHCDVSLSLHRNRRLVCHYCGYEEPAAEKCPECGSPFIGGFRAGTQQIEEIVRHAFPEAGILRMDADTTKGKDGHAEILRAFGRHEADILVGTQMIVKGHDFPGVTLVGILAADLSLNVSDYQASERTFQLLTQAAGRAGRGERPGEVVIQTYDPEHYAIVSAADQDYLSFYAREMSYRRLAGYPPAGDMMAIHLASENQDQLELAAGYLAKFVRQLAQRRNAAVIGPADEAVARINDVYRKAMYLKHADFRVLTAIKNIVEQYIEINSGFKEILISFERR
ncbi:MAG: primosomal protein N' [Lachnospiraceae bacterium]|nr:primosomal protein N' [Lachnospiraceae bacterium]